MGLTEVHGCDADDEELTLWPEAADGRGEIFANWPGRQFFSANSALRGCHRPEIGRDAGSGKQGVGDAGSQRV
jgi:hypothetical protein